VIYTTRSWFSIPRIALDFVFWGLSVALAVRIPSLTPLVILFIGAFPMHDLLVHGHETVHRHVADKWINELLCWLTHALAGISGSAYRAFHFDHHRWAHTARDPEFQLLSAIRKGAPGWTFLAIPFISHLAVNSYPFRVRKSARIRTVAELIAMVILHFAIAVLFGIRNYLLFVIAPIFSGLSIVVIARSITEHHGTDPRDRWRNARSIKTSPLLQFLWSNTNFHLEHHLFPGVPFHRLPALSRAIAAEATARGSAVEGGYLRVTPRLLREREHFKEAL